MCPFHLYRSPLSVPVMATSAEQNAAQRMDCSSPTEEGGKQGELGESSREEEGRWSCELSQSTPYLLSKTCSLRS